MTPSNEHLVHLHLAERLAEATAHHARRHVADAHPEPLGAGRTRRRILAALALPLHPTRKGTPA